MIGGKIMRKIKIAIVFILCLFCVTLFSSCEKPGTELSELMIMQGIGIDFDNNIYTVTVEILNNEQSGSPGGDGTSENKTKIYSANGKTVSQALRKLTEKSGNEPLFAHNRVIILGEKAINRDLRDVIDFFERDYDSRVSQLICVAKNSSAEDLIRAELFKDGVKCEILENMLEEGYNNSIIPRIRIIDAVNHLKDATLGLCIPAVSVQKNGENENYYLDGCGVFGADGKFLKYIDSATAEGLAFLNDTVKKGYITANISDKGKATFLINKSKTSFEIIEDDGVLKYNMKIKLSCDLDEIEGQENFKNDTEILNALQKGVGESICKKVENTFVSLQNTPSSDVIRFGKRLRLENLALYKTLAVDWGNVFPEIKLSVTVETTIRRIGEETFNSQKEIS